MDLESAKLIICNYGGWVDNYYIRLTMVAEPWPKDLQQAIRYLMDNYNYSLK